MTLVLGDYLWCQQSVQYFLVCYEGKNSSDASAAPATPATPATLTIGQHDCLTYHYVMCNIVYPLRYV